MIQDINDIIYIKVYLEGDFPAGFKRLSKAAEDVLEEFQSYNPHYLEFEFINPLMVYLIQKRFRISWFSLLVKD